MRQVTPWIVLRYKSSTGIEEQLDDIVFQPSCRGIKVRLEEDVSDSADQPLNQIQQEFMAVLWEVLEREKCRDWNPNGLLPSARMERISKHFLDVPKQRPTSVDSHRHGQDAKPDCDFASLIASWIHQSSVCLQQIRIETSGCREPEVSLSLIGSDQAQFQGFRLRLPQPDLVHLFSLLPSRGPSRLVKATFHVKALRLSEARAVAEYLKSSTIRELSIEGVEFFANEGGGALSPFIAEREVRESSLLFDVSKLIAVSLCSNRYLSSFRLSGRNRQVPYSTRGRCLEIFAQTAERNTNLQSFQFVWLDLLDSDPSSKTIQMFLKLNRACLRRNLFSGHKKTLWLDAIQKFNEGWLYDLDCVYYLLTNAVWIFG